MNLTDAQARALSAVASGNVAVGYGWRGSRYTSGLPKGIGEATLTALVGKGLIDQKPRSMGAPNAMFEITDKGREILGSISTHTPETVVMYLAKGLTLGEARIDEVNVASFTDSMVTMPNGDRRKRHSQYESFCDTYEGAYRILERHLQESVECAHKQLEWAQVKLDTFRKEYKKEQA